MPACYSGKLRSSGFTNGVLNSYNKEIHQAQTKVSVPELCLRFTDAGIGKVQVVT